MKNNNSLKCLTDELKQKAKNAVRGSRTADEVRQRLTNAGFFGESAAVNFVTTEKDGLKMSMFQFMVRTKSGEIIQG